jgi:hypothetical protein
MIQQIYKPRNTFSELMDLMTPLKIGEPPMHFALDIQSTGRLDLLLKKNKPACCAKSNKPAGNVVFMVK